MAAQDENPPADPPPGHDPGAGLPVVRVVGAAILHRGKCLVAQRGRHMAEPLKWEFPGGKIEPGEDPRQALAREIREELALEVEVRSPLGRGASCSGRRRIELEVFTAAIVGGELHLAEHRRADWFDAAAIDALDWAAADVPVLPELKRWLGS